MNRPNNLTAAILRVLQDNQRRLHLAVAGRKHAREQNWRAVALHADRFFSNLISPNSPNIAPQASPL